MEWMLQVVDEIDDALSALWLCALGLAAEFGLVAAYGLESQPPRPVSDRRGNPTPP
jgi:hypothetical protein